MLVDAHAHLWTRENLPDGNRWSYARMWSWYRGFEFTGTRRRFLPASDQRGPWRDADEVFPRVGISAWDPEGEDLIDYMDALGIDKIVNMTVDWGIAWGEEPEADVFEVNEHAASLREKLPGRYYQAVGVDPRRRNAAEIAEKFIKEHGAVAIKLLAANGFSPDDHICYPVYEVAKALKVPIVVHTGTGDLASFVEPAHPWKLEAPAKDFPDVQFVAAHAGGGLDGLWREIILMTQFVPNIAVDLAEWQYPVQPTDLDPGREQEFVHVLNILRRNMGAHNIIWATDYMKGHHRENDQFIIDLMNDFSGRAKKFGYTFTEEEAELIRAANAIRIYGLS